MSMSKTALAFALCIAATAATADPGTTLRAIELKDKPASDARTVASVAKDAVVDIITRQGAWIQLKSGTSLGWAKLFDVRLAPIGGVAKGSGMGGAEALNLAMGNRGSSVTTGVKGLDADMLKAATPNAAQFAKLASFAQSRDQAQAFARAGRLTPRDVPVLNAADTVAPPVPAAAPAKKAGAQ